MVLNVRILHLPMAFNESRTHAAVQKYMRSSRSEAPYLPSNVDFVAANNGIAAGAEGVADVVFAASYMVLGLGDVYLGAPCAVPVDPRYDLSTPSTKVHVSLFNFPAESIVLLDMFPSPHCDDPLPLHSRPPAPNSSHADS